MSRVKIHPVNDGFVVSVGDTWIPGVYTDRQSAEYAPRFSDDILQGLQDSTHGGVITFEMLQKLTEVQQSNG